MRVSKRFQLLRPRQPCPDTINHQAIGHIIINGHWERIGLLEDHSDFLTQFDRIGPWSVDIMSIVEDSSCGGDLMVEVAHAVNGF